jgi:hypothetical protein
MIRLLPILLLFGIAAPSFAFQMVGGMPIALCSFSTSDADVLGESFEGAEAGYDNSGWSETEAGSSSVDPNVSHSGTLACTDKCSHAIEVVFDGSNSGYTVKTFTGESTLYNQFYIRVASEGLANEDSQAIVSGRGSTDNPLWVVYFYQHTDGTYRFSLSYRNTSDTLTSYASLATVAVGTWYRVRVTWVNNGTGHFYADGDEIGAGFSTCDTEDQAAFRIGASTVAETITYQVDNVKLDNDEMPGACPE